MEELVAKRYVRALMHSSTQEELKNYQEMLLCLETLFRQEEIREFVTSAIVPEGKKKEILLSAVEGDKKFANFISLLAEKKRLGLIGAISKELGYQMAVLNNEFEGVIYSKADISDEDVRMLEASLSKQSNAKIRFRKKIGDFDGIKVEVENLGLEVSFSKSRIRSQMIDHILKAI